MGRILFRGNMHNGAGMQIFKWIDSQVSGAKIASSSLYFIDHVCVLSARFKLYLQGGAKIH